jgi:hypothetical protein
MWSFVYQVTIERICTIIACDKYDFPTYSLRNNNGDPACGLYWDVSFSSMRSIPDHKFVCDITRTHSCHRLRLLIKKIITSKSIFQSIALLEGRATMNDDFVPYNAINYGIFFDLHEIDKLVMKLRTCISAAFSIDDFTCSSRSVLLDRQFDQQRYGRNPTDRSSRPNVAAIIRSVYRSLLYMFLSILKVWQ